MKSQATSWTPLLHTAAWNAPLQLRLGPSSHHMGFAVCAPSPLHQLHDSAGPPPLQQAAPEPARPSQGNGSSRDMAQGITSLGVHALLSRAEAAAQQLAAQRPWQAQQPVGASLSGARNVLGREIRATGSAVASTTKASTSTSDGSHGSGSASPCSHCTTGAALHAELLESLQAANAALLPSPAMHGTHTCYAMAHAANHAGLQGMREPLPLPMLLSTMRRMADYAAALRAHGRGSMCSGVGSESGACTTPSGLGHGSSQPEGASTPCAAQAGMQAAMQAQAWHVLGDLLAMSACESAAAGQALAPGLAVEVLHAFGAVAGAHHVALFRTLMATSLGGHVPTAAASPSLLLTRPSPMLHGASAGLDPCMVHASATQAALPLHQLLSAALAAGQPSAQAAIQRLAPGEVVALMSALGAVSHFDAAVMDACMAEAGRWLHAEVRML